MEFRPGRDCSGADWGERARYVGSAADAAGLCGWRRTVDLERLKPDRAYWHGPREPLVAILRTLSADGVDCPPEHRARLLRVLEAIRGHIA